jgi:transposase
MGEWRAREDHDQQMTTMTAAQIRAQTAPMSQHPDPQMPERPRPPRRYPAAYKLRILAQYEQLDKKGKGALLRREGLYTSLISEWGKQRDKGALAALAALGQAQRRGRPPVDPLVRENARLVADNARLRDQLARQAKVLEVQGELSALLSRLAASSADQDPSEPTGPADPTPTGR